MDLEFSPRVIIIIIMVILYHIYLRSLLKRLVASEIENPSGLLMVIDHRPTMHQSDPTALGCSLSIYHYTRLKHTAVLDSNICCVTILMVDHLIVEFWTKEYFSLPFAV